MKYEYKCPVCSWVIRSDYRADWMWCANPHCFTKARRIWSVNIRPSFQPHFNPTVNAPVTSHSQFRSELSRASELASSPKTNFLADGTPVTVDRPPANFQPVDIRDRETLGVTNEGLDATYNDLRRQGRDSDAKRLKKLMDE